jgi:hypothetical protein
LASGWGLYENPIIIGGKFVKSGNISRYLKELDAKDVSNTDEVCQWDDTDGIICLESVKGYDLYFIVIF